MERAYKEIFCLCNSYAIQQGWDIQRDGAHLGYYTWKNEPWWPDMEVFIRSIDVSTYPIPTWDWVDQCDIGIDYFNQHVMKHRDPYPIFKKYIKERLKHERIQPV